VASKTQVVLATQSVTLLDQFEAGEVIVAERSNGESTFRRRALRARPLAGPSHRKA
jgi:predicted ATPase